MKKNPVTLDGYWLTEAYVVMDKDEPAMVFYTYEDAKAYARANVYTVDVVDIATDYNPEEN